MIKTYRPPLGRRVLITSPDINRHKEQLSWH